MQCYSKLIATSTMTPKRRRYATAKLTVTAQIRDKVIGRFLTEVDCEVDAVKQFNLRVHNDPSVGVKKKVAGIYTRIFKRFQGAFPWLKVHHVSYYKTRVKQEIGVKLKINQEKDIKNFVAPAVNPDLLSDSSSDEESRKTVDSLYTLDKNGHREVRVIVDLVDMEFGSGVGDVDVDDDESIPTWKSRRTVYSDDDDSTFCSVESDSESYDDGTSDEEVEEEDDTSVSSICEPGRKKGDTLEKQDQDKRVLTLAYNVCAMKFNAQRRLAVELRGKAAKVPRQTYSRIIVETEEVYGIEKGTIKVETVRRRLYKRNLICSSRGPTSPMAGVETLLVATVLEMESNRDPLCVSEGLELANSLIKDTVHQDEVVKWKNMHLGRAQASRDPDEAGKLGPNYWRGFLRRHPMLQEKKHVKFDQKKEDFVKMDLFEAMYRDIYTRMVRTGIAIKHNEPRCFDRRGNVVDSGDPSRVGMPSHYEMVHPEKVFFVDETGDNTNQGKNGHRGGQKFITTRNGKAREKCSTKDCHFTVLPFTAANGEPVMCAVVIAKKGPLTMEEKTGFNAMAQTEECDELDMENIDAEKYCDGKDKVFPYGPACMFNGKKVPAYVTSTENGSITTEELTLMLKYMDDIGVIDRSDGIDPMLIMDGHSSRMMLPFLTYVNDEVHPWSVMLGIPYGTYLWQVGDSAEQNGSFKIAMTKWKRWLRQQKNDYGLKQTIEKTDIMLLLTLAWEESFAKVETNKNAAADRGWCPLNFALLLHDDLKEGTTTEVECAVSHAKILAFNSGHALIDPHTLNMKEGFAETIIERMCDAVTRKKETQDTDLTLLASRRRATAKKRIEDSKTLHAGSWVLGYGHYLGPEAVELSNRNSMKRKAEELGKKKRKYDKGKKFDNEVHRVLTESKPEGWLSPADCCLSDLKIMVRWFNRPGDAKCLLRKAELWARFEDTKDRSNHDRSCLGPDDKPATIGSTTIPRVAAAKKTRTKPKGKLKPQPKTNIKKASTMKTPSVARGVPKRCVQTRPRKASDLYVESSESSSCGSIYNSNLDGNDSSDSCNTANHDTMFLDHSTDDEQDKAELEEWNQKAGHFDEW